MLVRILREAGAPAVLILAVLLLSWTPGILIQDPPPHPYEHLKYVCFGSAHDLGIIT